MGAGSRKHIRVFAGGAKRSERGPETGGFLVPRAIGGSLSGRECFLFFLYSAIFNVS